MTGAVEYILLGDIGAPGPSPTMTVTDKLSFWRCAGRCWLLVGLARNK